MRGIEDSLPASETILDLVDAAWVPAIYLDVRTNELLVEWMLGRRELDQLEGRISKGKRALTALRADDPMHDSLKVELEALQDRLSQLSEMRTDEAGRIRLSARQYDDERAITEEGQERLETQEQAHEWLYEED